MLDTYFFVPGDKDKFLSKINDIKADFIVVDLEDAVSENEKCNALNKVLKLDIKSNYYVRFPLNGSFSPSEITSLITHFNGKLVIPKLEQAQAIDALIKVTQNNIKLALIILIETPLGYVNLQSILQKHHNIIEGLAFGTHDFCSVMGIKHLHENLIQYKREIAVLTKAYNVKFIDGVDLDLQNFDTFINEALVAYQIGAQGKFLIHPKQLQVINQIEFVTESEINEAFTVYEHIKNIDPKDINVHIINGKIYEKPHIMRISKLVQKINNKKNI